MFLILFLTSHVYAQCTIVNGKSTCLGMEPTQISSIKSDMLVYVNSDKPVITITGVPNELESLEIDDHSGNIIFYHNIELPPTGVLNYTLDISSYKHDVYSANVNTSTGKITTSFAVGLEPSGERIDLISSKLTYVPNETIQIMGFWNPNTMINLDLVDPTNQIKNSAMLQSDSVGNFTKKFVVPSNAINGTWQVRVTSGLVHTTLNIFVISQNLQQNQPMQNVHVMEKNMTLSKHPAHVFSMQDSPLKQFKSGVAANDVKCKQDLQLVIKIEDGSPACVTSSTALALESHGWAISPKSTIMHVELDQSHYPPNNLDYYFIKGIIYTANGPVQNSTVSIFGNNIPLGNAMTDPTGCFQFDSWNNTEINQEMSNASNNHQESYTLKITSAYLGDETHDAVNGTKSAVVYFQLFPIPPPFYVSSTNPPVIQVKQGDSASLKLSVTHLTGGPVGPMELTVQRLPCGITYAIPSNAASNNGTFNISIATQDYTHVGKYYLDVIQDTSHFENPNIIPDPYIGMINLEVLPK